MKRKWCSYKDRSILENYYNTNGVKLTIKDVKELKNQTCMTGDQIYDWLHNHRKKLKKKNQFNLINDCCAIAQVMKDLKKE